MRLCGLHCVVDYIPRTGMKNFGLSTEFTLLIFDRNGRRGSRMQEACMCLAVCFEKAVYGRLCIEGSVWEAVCF